MQGRLDEPLNKNGRDLAVITGKAMNGMMCANNISNIKIEYQGGNGMKRIICMMLALALCLGISAAASGGPSGGMSGSALPDELSDLPTVEAEPWVEVSDERIGLEGPAFDGDGNLYVCSTGLNYPVNYILKIDPEKTITTIYEGELSPLGLAFHEDGRLFAVCREGVLLVMEPDGTLLESLTPTYDGKTLSLNDLCFTSDGDLFVTDWQGSVDDPTGGIYLLTRESGYEDTVVIADRLAGPNGISLSPDEQTLWVGMTNEQAVYRIDLNYADGLPAAASIEKIYENSGSGQPDSNKTDSAGNVYQAIIQTGRILVFNEAGEPIMNVVCPDSSLRMTSNLAIKPGTNEGYMLAAGFGAGSWIYTFESLAPARGESTAAASEEISGETYFRLDDVLAWAVGDAPSIVLKGANILDSTHNGEVLDVLVRDGTIEELGENLKGDEVIDLTGYTLMPGLIDSHVHVAGSSGYGIDLLTTWAQHGITTVREEGMLSTSGEMEFIDLIEEANADPQSAYLVSCGKYFDVTGGYGMGPTGDMGIVVENEDDIIAEIDLKAELGYPQVKIGINSETSRMSPEQLMTAIGYAHENDMPVAAHVNYAKHLEELVGYGLDEAAHTPSDEMDETLISAMVENDVRMNTSGSESYEEQKIANLKAFYEAGGMITVGTDLMRNYDTCMTALASEMVVLAKAGLTVQEVIACATHNNALALGIEDTGDILPGYQADIVAVKGSVDKSFDALGEISFVMNDGAVIVG